MKKIMMAVLVVAVILGAVNLGAEELAITPAGTIRYGRVVNALMETLEKDQPISDNDFVGYLEKRGFSRDDIFFAAGYFLLSIQSSSQEKEPILISNGFPDEAIEDLNILFSQVYLIKGLEKVVASLESVGMGRDPSFKDFVDQKKDQLTELKENYMKVFFPFNYQSYSLICLVNTLPSSEISSAPFLWPEWPENNP